MSNSMTNEYEDIVKVVNALKKVPEKKLRIIELANSVPIKGGDLDPFVLMEMIPEINTATAEAAAYGAQTINAVSALTGIRSLPVDTRLRPLTEEDLEDGLQF